MARNEELIIKILLQAETASSEAPIQNIRVEGFDEAIVFEYIRILIDSDRFIAGETIPLLNGQRNSLIRNITLLGEDFLMNAKNTNKN